MEMIECFTINNESTDTLIPRSALKNHPCYFRVVHLWFEFEDTFLVQKRAKEDDVTPFMWAFTTGLVDPKEAPNLAIIRETKEELGIVLNPKDLTLIKIVPTHQKPYRTFTYVFHVNVTVKPSFKCNHEVLEIDYWPLHKIKRAIETNTFWNYPKLLNDVDYFKELYEKRLQ